MNEMIIDEMKANMMCDQPLFLQMNFFYKNLRGRVERAHFGRGRKWLGTWNADV